MINILKGRTAAISILALSSFAFVGCSSSTVVTTLSAIVDTAAAATGVITGLTATSTISGPEADMIMNYLEEVSTAASTAISQWNASGQTVEQKVTAIIGDFAPIVGQKFNIPNSAIQATLNAVSTAIEAFLAQLHAGRARAHVLGLSSQTELPTNFGTRAKLHSIKAKADRTHEKIELWRARYSARRGY